MNIAQNPSLNAGALWSTIPSVGAVFSTSVASPAAWTIAIYYTGGGLDSPRGIANDASGNVWLPNSNSNTVTKLDNTGAPQSGANGYTSAGAFDLPTAIAIDASGNAWVTNAGNNTFTEISSGGTIGAPVSGNGLNLPIGIAFDVTGNIWIANNGSNSVSAFDSSGTAIGNYTGGGITSPIAIAVNPQ
jgi:DNA-binding beta-propeller fold protein YncE